MHLFFCEFWFMTLIKLNPDAPNLVGGSLVTIGNFDGVHLGHQALCDRLNHIKSSLNLPSVVLLFEPQAKEFFANPKKHERILSLREKIYCLKKLNIDYVYCLDFNHKIAKMSADSFLQDVIIKTLNARQLVQGHDFHFGYQRQGNPAFLNQALLKHACNIEWIADNLIDDERISSTIIRTLLRAGNLEKASLLMGRPYFVIGRVGYGRQLAQQWGVPTANIRVFQQKQLLKGVFCVRIFHCASGKMYNGIANLGIRPTFLGQKMILEAHLFDFNASLYGQELQVFFLKKIRDEQKFENLSALEHQILADVKASKLYFDNKD